MFEEIIKERFKRGYVWRKHWREGMFGENIEDRERVCIEKIFERGHLWRKYLREGVFGENIGERVCKEKR